MKNYARNAAVSLFAGAALAAGGLAPASAAPVFTGGLVNVTIVDVLDIDDTIVSVEALNNVTLQVAAQVCGVAVGVLAVDLADGTAVCNVTQDSDSTKTTTVTQRRAR
nr:hypothetical protein [uncultured Friedmanniella sp.]